MEDQNKTKAQLIDELRDLRRQLAAFVDKGGSASSDSSHLQ
ncbi:MAG: hypothetical protein VYC64_15515 [Candidatus Latescibacterota bacterium]|jgi:hypothetical protein|nr:hypothetical protein [Candidatus Latescibacterota bacterium]MEC8992604.1 hypothetical protein [Candidatus Latescibacterota bacterium]MED5416352.1 hypothetical protein [Candidatus Latescibacterota bacterium]MEE3039403.1 hypothetical protein [Candidatus Latescibacterota bacterium]MEE3335888.1 hypothetical protein [Candidatus Latescibacterota bacterium]|tara:strand:+ start:554 stop:676 length:123 start_codon:yes stop_codon:yes gene_type:complete